MDKNSKVLALKYRPQTFDDLIGQEVVAETIINSIKANKIPNAYLFTGIRGVGKTTIARIVAIELGIPNVEPFIIIPHIMLIPVIKENPIAKMMLTVLVRLLISPSM